MHVAFYKVIHYHCDLHSLISEDSAELLTTVEEVSYYLGKSEGVHEDL